MDALGTTSILLKIIYLITRYLSIKFTINSLICDGAFGLYKIHTLILAKYSPFLPRVLFFCLVNVSTIARSRRSFLAARKLRPVPYKDGLTEPHDCIAARRFSVQYCFYPCAYHQDSVAFLFLVSTSR